MWTKWLNQKKLIEKMIRESKDLHKIDVFIKNMITVNAFWLYETYQISQTLCYYTHQIDDSIIVTDEETNKTITIVFIPHSAYNHEDFDPIAATILHTELLLKYNVSISDMIEFFDTIDYETYLQEKNIGRIVWFICWDILKKDVSANTTRFQWYRHFWNKDDQLLTISKRWKYYDHIFGHRTEFQITNKQGVQSSKHYIKNNTFAKVDKQKEETQSYFTEQFSDTPSQDDKKQFNRVMTQNAEASANIDWYTHETALWQQVIKNIMNSYNVLSAQSANKVSLALRSLTSKDFYNQLHTLMVEAIYWQPNIENGMYEGKIYGEYRKENVIYSEKLTKEYGLKEIQYIPPSHKDIYLLMKDLMSLVQDTSFTKHHPIVISTVISSVFLLISPYYDWNERMSRMIFAYVLKRLGYIEHYHQCPINIILKEKQQEYNQHIHKLYSSIKKYITIHKNDDGTYNVSYDTVDLFKQKYRLWWLIEFFTSVVAEAFELSTKMCKVESQSITDEFYWQLWYYFKDYSFSVSQKKQLKFIFVDKIQKENYELSKELTKRLISDFTKDEIKKLYMIITYFKKKYWEE